MVNIRSSPGINQNTLENSTSFPKNMKNSHMVLFDVENLFTNVPVDETVKMVINNFFAYVSNWSYFKKKILW